MTQCMTHCNKENLAHLLADDLDLDTKIDTLEHLELCTSCRDAFYGLSRERDSSLFIRRPYNVERVAKGSN
jgi:hypothetical protein